MDREGAKFGAEEGLWYDWWIGVDATREDSVGGAGYSDGVGGGGGLTDVDGWVGVCLGFDENCRERTRRRGQR